YDPRRLALLGELRDALTRDELVVHYQPKVSFRTGEVVSVEALVRWDHPRYGLLYPDQFIAVAEATRLIDPLTDIVLAGALSQCASRWTTSAPATRRSPTCSACRWTRSRSTSRSCLAWRPVPTTPRSWPRRSASRMPCA